MVFVCVCESAYFVTTKTTLLSAHVEQAHQRGGRRDATVGTATTIFLTEAN